MTSIYVIGVDVLLHLMHLTAVVDAPAQQLLYRVGLVINAESWLIFH